MNIGIVIPILNQFQLAIEAIESIKTNDDHRFDIIPMLNYRTSDSLSASWNKGCLKSFERNDFTLVVNDDIVFTPWTIDELIKAFSFGPKDLILATGYNIRDLTNHMGAYSWSKPSTPPQYVPHPDFSCFMLDKRIFDEIGMFDENFIPAYFEDNDYHHRIKLAGYEAYNISSAPFYHYGSKTQQHNPVMPAVPSAAFEANRFYFINKWGGEPGRESFSHPYNNPELTHKDWIKKS